MMGEMLALKYCGIDVSKPSLICAAIGDLDDDHNEYLLDQVRGIGIIGDEPLALRCFDNSWTRVVAMTRWLRSVWDVRQEVDEFMFLANLQSEEMKREDIKS